MKKPSSLLREAEERLEIFKRFVETSGQALGMADLEGRIFFVNATLCRLLGEESPADTYQQDIFTYYSPETVKRLREEILPLVRQEGQWVGELDIIDKRGHVTPTIENIFLLRDEAGAPLCFANVITDISERTHMEAELRTYRDQLEALVSQRTAQLEESNALLRAQIEKHQRTEILLSRLTAVMESTNHLVAMASPDGMILYINTAGRQMVGLKADEDIQRHALSEVHPPWALRIIQNEGIPSAIMHGVWQGETALINREGKEIPVSQVIKAHRTVNGELEYLSTIMRDITERKQAEEALRESEDRFRSQYHGSPTPTFTWQKRGPDFVLVDCNDAADTVTGGEVRKYMHKTAHEIYAHQEDILQDLRACFENKSVFRKERLSQHFMPGRHVIITYAFVPRDLVVVHVEDVTERKQAEQERSRLMAILDSTSDLVGVALPDGQGVYLNAAGRRMAGFGADEDLSKRNMSEVHPTWAWPDVEKGIQKAVKQGLWEGETVVVNHQNGREIPVSQVIMAHRGASGEIEYISTILRDISDRKHAEEALRESEEKLRTIVNNMQDAYYRCDLNGELIYTTASAARLLGCSSAEEMIGLKIKDFYYYPGEAEEQYKILQSSGKLTKYEVTLKRRDNGEPVIVLANSQFFRDRDGNIIGIEGVYSDITEHKRAEAALEKRIMALTRPLDSATGIAFEELFNIADIQRLQDEFARATGVASIITNTDGTPITVPSNFCRLCNEIIRRTEKGLANCYKSDAALGRASTQGACIQPCMSGGLWDAGAGISVGGQHIANWLIGQVRDETQTEENMRRYAREIGADEQAVVEAFHEVPAMSREQFQHVSQVLFTLANQLSNIAYQNVQQARFIAERRQAEEALRKSEEKYRRIVDTVNEGIWTVDADSRTTFVDAHIARIIGYPVEEIIGRSFDAFLFEEDKADHAQRLETRKQGISERYERRLRHKDGHAVFVLISITPIFDDERHFQGSFAMFTDITERKQAEAALRESEQRFRVAQNLSLDAFTILHPVRDENGMIVDFVWDYVNPAACRILKHAPEKLLGQRLLAVLPGSKTNSDLFERYARVMETGESHDLELCYEAEGIKGWFRNMTVKLGDTIAVSFADITERKQAELDLKESLEILAEAERIGQTGSWKRDLATNAITWSVGTYRIMGFPEQEAISLEQFLSRIHPDDREALIAKLREIAEKGTPYLVEFRIILPDGTVRHLEGRGEVSLDPRGKPDHIHGTARDITERKRLEDDLIKAQRLDSIGTLAGGIAHDYNNLLTAILGNMELAKMNIPKTDQAHTILTKAEEAAMMARDLTRRLITFSQGGYPMGKVMPLRDLLTESVCLALSGSNTKAIWEIAADLPTVKIDENQIRQVIHNIVINAHEAMPRGGRLTIAAERTSLESDNPLGLPAGIYVRLAFRDEGRGIPAENLPRIFDPYFTTKDMGTEKGLGLSLSICHSIIKRHGGHIMVESHVGLGTTVTIYLPAATIQPAI